jgi:microcystin degradation protein MlrC
MAPGGAEVSAAQDPSGGQRAEAGQARRFRVAIGGFVHETNQYVATPTTLEQFEVSRGDAIFDSRMSTGRTFLGGMLTAVREFGATPIGTVHAIAQPWGTIDAAAYIQLKGELLDALGAARPVDAVALDLHGAAIAEGCDDVEADLCWAVRELVGPDVVIAVTHDLHGHITQTQADAVDVLFPVHEYPHDDMYERGVEAIEWIGRRLAGAPRPAIHVERLPLLLMMTTTYRGAGRKVRDLCQALEQRPGAVDVAFVHGFPYCDIPLVGAHVIATVEGTADAAAALAREAAAAIWELRAELAAQENHPQPATAVRVALAESRTPVVINETSDNPGCGAPGDGTQLLQALLDARPSGAVFCGIRDGDVVSRAQAAGPGATIDVSLGAKTDSLHGAPIAARAYVRSLTDGETVLEAATGGWRYPLGPTALLVIDGVEVIVFTRNVQTLDQTPLLLHGIDPAARRLIALKSSHAFRSGFEQLAGAIITTNPPGLSTVTLEALPRSRSPRPLFPLDPAASYP